MNNDESIKKYMLESEFKKYYQIGEKSWANNDFEDAIKYFDEALKFKPNDTLTLYLKILSLNELNKTEEMISCCKLLLSIETTDETDLHNVVCCLYEVGQYDGLIEYCDKALKLYPNNRIINEIKEELIDEFGD